MKKLVLFLLLTSLSYGQERMKKITGQVTYMETPLVQAEVKHVASGDITTTDVDGRYEIMASTGDILQYTYPSMRTLEIVVEDVTRILNITLSPMVNELDEVVVTKSRRRSQADLAKEYSSNPDLIITAFGILDKNRAAGAMYMLPPERIQPIYLCIIDLLRGQFPGVGVQGDCINGGSVLVRGANSINFVPSAIYDVDGQIFQTAPIWLDISQMRRIAILSSLNSTVPYGAMGAGGVVVINTTSIDSPNKPVVDQARLTNNFYAKDALSREQVALNDATYMKELNASVSFSQARSVYQKHSLAQGNSPYFIIDAVEYFSHAWPNEDFAVSIYKEHQSWLDGNAVHLKALAYIFESSGLDLEAHELYKKVFILRPNYVQSYMDMANSYRALGDHSMAASMYARYGYLVDAGFMVSDTTGFSPIMERDYNNLLALMGSEIVGKRNSRLFSKVQDDVPQGTRVVFEWNDSEAEFDLQFVNPLNQYTLWRHSLEQNAELIALEKTKGYAVQEFFIDGSLQGVWQVNVKYLGNKSLTPSYLKATVYHNYGTAAQRRETKVFKLALRNVSQQLFTVSTTGGLALN